MKISKPCIAITIGDPAGIGPEIVAGMLGRFRPRYSRPVVVGSPAAFRAYRRPAGAEDKWLDEVEWITEVDVKSLADRGPAARFVDTGCRDGFAVGRDGAGGGRHAGMAMALACKLAKQGVVKGIVTAPLSKIALQQAGWRFTGHTEFLAQYFDAPDCQMMMVHGDLRVVPLTRHIPLRAVSRAISVEGIVTAVAVVHAALKRDFRISRPHIAIAGVNPHAGEGGVIGREELDTVMPAVKRIRRRGIRVTGPVPGDALFQQAQDGTFDAFVSMYHDQGLIPFKLLARRRGVNVTVGLPIVRTSVDHGVAYDIAGKGIASTDSLKAAYRLAEQIVARR